MKTVILYCECNHKDQDQRNGAGKRVMNQVKTPSGAKEKFRCTVCGKVREG
jgi:hypothetical protein